MIKFYLKESLKLISRAKASFVLSLVAAYLSTGLIVFSAGLYFLSSQFQQKLKQHVSISIFLNDNLQVNQLKKIKSELSQSGYFSSIYYISKEKAAERFVKETGEDFREILDYNPLPASFEVGVKSEYVSNAGLNKIKNEVNTISGIDEVVMDERITAKILDYLYSSRRIILAVTIILLILSVYIIASTNKLITSRKYEELETMKLVGAKLFSIKAPIYINSLFTGFIAASMVNISAYFFIKFLTAELNFAGIPVIHLFIISLIILFLGIGLSLLVTIFSLKKVTLRI